MPRFGTITDHSQLNNLAYAASGHTGFSNVVNHEDLGNLEYVASGHSGFAQSLVLSHLTPAQGEYRYGDQGLGIMAHFYRCFLPYPLDVTEIGTFISYNGAAGSVVELGIYSSAKLLLGSVELDGTVEGSRLGSLGLSLPAGDIWMAIVNNDGGDVPEFRCAVDYARTVLGVDYMGEAAGCYPLPATIPALDVITGSKVFVIVAH